MLRYEPVTGHLYWITSPNTSRIQPGMRAGAIQDGYRRISLTIDGKRQRMMAARVAWMLQTKEDPYPLIVDHIDGDNSNDRWSNLRLATDSQNQWNRKPNTGAPLPKGVSHHPLSRTGKPRKQPYVARVMAHGKSHHVGSYATPEEAHEAYLHAAAILHGQFFRGSSDTT